MTSEELIRMFRNDPTWMGKDIADHIEALLAERDALKAEVERLKGEVFEMKLDRPYVLGFNAGWDECEKQGDEVWNSIWSKAMAELLKGLSSHVDRMLAEAKVDGMREAAAMVGYKAHIIRAAIQTPAKGESHE